MRIRTFSPTEITEMMNRHDTFELSIPGRVAVLTAIVTGDGRINTIECNISPGRMCRIGQILAWRSIFMAINEQLDKILIALKRR